MYMWKTRKLLLPIIYTDIAHLVSVAWHAVLVCIQGGEESVES